MDSNVSRHSVIYRNVQVTLNFSREDLAEQELNKLFIRSTNKSFSNIRITEPAGFDCTTICPFASWNLIDCLITCLCCKAIPAAKIFKAGYFHDAGLF
jgi:hypothetical protein